MKHLCVRFILRLITLPGLLTLFVMTVSAEEKISDSAMAQIQALEADKDSRSATHRKLDAQFLFQLKQNRRQVMAAGVTALRPDLEIEPDGRVLVDINADITQALLDQIAKGGGTVVHSSPRYHSIRALVLLEQLEGLAEVEGVHFIRRGMRPRTHSGSVNSEGDATHLAAFVRTNYAATGAGVKVGVISDGIANLPFSQSSGNLPSVTVLPGQAGPIGANEGCAMLEIVHDLAPGATLFYATAFNGEASFAENILTLRSNGCDVIVDDIMYFTESPFQDGIIAQAVNEVTASGALYFSSAGNEGNFKDGTSGTWEGNFVDSGQTLPGYPGKIHSFGAQNYNLVTANGQGVDLFWSDPLGASTNDYDLFLLDPSGATVLYAANNAQTGTQDPYEFINQVAYSGYRIVVVRKSGSARFLHLDTYRGRLSVKTTGATRGHSTATNAISVAAVSAFNTYPNPFVAGSFNHVRTYSCDGPRRVFFHADGTPITPGNFSATGGALRQKPDLTAADGVSTSVPGFSPFNGSSAAATHAAAIAALVRSAALSLTLAQIRSGLTNAVLDIEAPGYDINSGAGILMADRALGLLLPRPILLTGSATLANESVPNGAFDPGEIVTVSFPLTNVGYAATTNLIATLLNTGGVTLASAPQTYGAIAAHGGSADQPFSFVPTGSCGDTIVATLQLQDGATNLGTVSYTFDLGIPRIPLTEGFDTMTPPSLPAGWTLLTSGAGQPWNTTSNWFYSGTNVLIHVLDSGGTGDSSLTSPPFPILTPSAQISFIQYQNMPTHAAAVLEISTNNGPFLDILEIGGVFVTNGYNSYIDPTVPSPLAGRQAWTGISGAIQTIANLPPTVAGHTLRLRLRYATGEYYVCSHCLGNGWGVDSIVCNDGSACSTAATNDVMVTASSSSSHVYLAGNLDFNLKVVNTGPGLATGISVTNLLPAGFTLNSWTASNGVGLVSTAGNTMIFSITNLPGGGIKTIALSGTANSAGVISNVTRIVRSDGGSTSISNATAFVTIHLPGMVVGSVLFYEGEADFANAGLTISLTSPATTNISARFATADLTAIAGTDYVSTNGIVTFAPGASTRMVEVRVLDDSLSEADETFAVTLSVPTNCVLVQAAGTGTIWDDDPYPTLSLSPASVVVGKPDSGTTNAVFGATLSAVSGQPVTADLNVIGITTIPGRDFSLATPTVVFAPGETSKSVIVVVSNHVSAKPSQDFELYWGGVSGASPEGDNVRGTIITASSGKLDHFTWNSVSTPQSNGLPFNVSVSARDFFEGLVTNFSGAATLAGFKVNAYRTNASLANVELANTSYGSGGGYTFVPSTNLLATHLRAYLPYPDYAQELSLWTDNGLLLATRNVIRTNDVPWVEEPLPAPVELKAGHAYRVAISSASAGIPIALPIDSPDLTIIQRLRSNDDGFPELTDPWEEYRPLPLVEVRYRAGVPTPLPVMPNGTANFTNGIWTGAVTVLIPGTNAALMASDAGGHWGISSPFNVNGLPSSPPLLTNIAIASGKIQFGWNAIPGLFYQVQYKTNLNQVSWLNFGVPIVATNTTMTWSTPNGADWQCFYRLLLNH